MKKALNNIEKRKMIQKIKLPRCSSLYSQFHYKVDRNDLQVLLNNSNKQTIINLQKLRKMDIIQINKLKDELKSTLNKLKQTQDQLTASKSHQKSFYQKKLNKIIQKIQSLSEIMSQKQKQAAEKYLIFLQDKIKDYLKIFDGKQGNESLVSYLIDEQLKKCSLKSKCVEIQMTNLEATQAFQEQKIQKLEQQLTRYREIQRESEEKVLRTVQQLKQQHCLTVKQLEHQKQQNNLLKSQNKDLQTQIIYLKNSIKEFKKSRHLNKIQEGQRIDNINNFLSEFKIEIKSEALQKFLMEERSINNEQEIKSNLTLYKQKLAYIFHLFKKFELKHIENYEKLKLQIGSLNKQMELKNWQILKQEKKITEYKEKQDLHRSIKEIKLPSDKKITETQVRRTKKKKYSLIL